MSTAIAESTLTAPTTFCAVVAIERLQNVEESVRQNATEADQDVIKLFARLALWWPPAQRAHFFAMQQAYENKELCHFLKRRLQFMSQELSHLYGKGKGSSYAFRDLGRMVLRMSKACGRVSSLMARVDVKFAPAAQLRSVTNSVRGMHVHVHALEMDAEDIVEKWELWKPYFMVVCMPQVFRAALADIESQKLHLGDLRDLSEPLFSRLADVSLERDGIMQEVEHITDTTSHRWSGLPTGQVDCQELDAVLLGYDICRERLSANKVYQTDVLDNIDELASSVRPTSLRGPQGAAIRVDSLIWTVREFEKLRIRTEQIHEIARDLIEQMRSIL